MFKKVFICPLLVIVRGLACEAQWLLRSRKKTGIMYKK